MVRDVTGTAEAGALVLFSGGQDSTTCLAWALDRFARVETVGFDYGQRHRVELTQRPILRDRLSRIDPRWTTRLGPDHVLDLASFGAIARTAMTQEIAIAIGAQGLPNTFVPGRNLAFLTYAAALATRRNLTVIVGGMCETDFSGYPDCRDDTIKAMQIALNLGMAQRFTIDTPLMWLTKAQTFALAQRLGGTPLIEAVVEDTHTCYLGERGARHAWGYGCGECPACRLRADGWQRWRDGLSHSPRER